MDRIWKTCLTVKPCHTEIPIKILKRITCMKSMIPLRRTCTNLAFVAIHCCRMDLLHVPTDKCGNSTEW